MIPYDPLKTVMFFEYTPEQQAFRHEIRAYLELSTESFDSITGCVRGSQMSHSALSKASQIDGVVHIECDTAAELYVDRQPQLSCSGKMA